MLNGDLENKKGSSQDTGYTFMTKEMSSSVYLMITERTKVGYLVGRRVVLVVIIGHIFRDGIVEA